MTTNAITSAPASQTTSSAPNFELLLQRNRDFVADAFPGHLTLENSPTLKTIVVGCVDPRVEPAKILGIDTGEAVVIRNIGGRITPKFFSDMLMLRLVAASAGAEPGAGWNLIVLHHTDCGITRLEPYPEMLAGYFGVDVADLEHAHVTDPFQSVVTDIETLRANPFFPAEFHVAGLVYDVHTGHVHTVAPLAPLR
jgi:carbonic anhydrase